MNEKNLEGNLVKLCAVEKDKDAELLALWNKDSEFIHLSDTGPAHLPPVKQIQDWLEEVDKSSSNFMIVTVIDSKRIGSMGLYDFDWTSRSACVGIGIGDLDYRGKGYGTEAMQLTLHYAFNELNLHRVYLSVFDINQPALRSYEKCGFKYEGVEREMIYKLDQRWNVVNMGILQAEWQHSQEG
jgi:RimJ/RimL family protein N-acetyltransferase